VDTLGRVDNEKSEALMRQTKRRFSEEYKAEAVRAWRESGRPMHRFAKELGISSSMLHRWEGEQRKVEQAGTTRTAVKAEREELLRLRRENEMLRQERDFLRSAAAYFAKERK
jgi:transposase